MPEHWVKRGECLTSIAQRYGFCWETIWNHQNNAGLRDRRADPSVLYAGDTVFVPERAEKTESVETGQTHRFRRKGIPDSLRIVLRDEDGEPRANTDYILRIDGTNREGTTYADGLLEESIFPGAPDGHLLILDENGRPIEEWHLALGGLDPVCEVSGVQMRLANLGYDCGEVDGQMGSRTREALEAYQRKHELEATGEIDDQTRQHLQDAHGS